MPLEAEAAFFCCWMLILGNGTGGGSLMSLEHRRGNAVRDHGVVHQVRDVRGHGASLGPFVDDRLDLAHDDELPFDLDVTHADIVRGETEIDHGVAVGESVNLDHAGIMIHSDVVKLLSLLGEPLCFDDADLESLDLYHMPIP